MCSDLNQKKKQVGNLICILLSKVIQPISYCYKMKNAKLPRIGALTIFFVASTFIFSSCSKKVHFVKSAKVPAAQGTVKITKTNNNNYEIDIKIYHLAEPSRLIPPKEAYVVWMRSEKNLEKNLGQITTSSGLLSKKLKSSFTTVTPFSPVKVYITAEDEANIQHPYGEVVLSTDTF